MDYFDNLGLFYIKKRINKKIIKEQLRFVTIEMWERLEFIIDVNRKKHSDEYYKNFEYLVKEFSK
jgi:hypothetical protein